MRHILFMAIIIAIANADENSLSGDLKRKEPGYLFTYPKTFLSGKNETVCLTLHDAFLPTKALIDLKIKERHHTMTKIMHSDHSCFELSVPQHNSTEVFSASLHLQLQLNGSIFTAHNQESILIYPNTDVTFIETDRSIYNQGDKVRIRILLLSQDLKASLNNNIVSFLKIINPQGFVVSVWNKITTELGLVQLEYQLADETTLGKWKIDCNGIIKHFYVKRYILPRFHVEVIAPKTIYFKTKSVKFKVCATYMFDKHVQGFVFLKISYAHISHIFTSKIEKIQNPCTLFEITNEQLSLTLINNNKDQWHMNVIATVTEKGTNRIESESATVTVRSFPYEIKFGEENVFFQPSLPYKGKLKMVDSSLTNQRNEFVKICYQVSVKKPWNIKPEECSNLEFDDDGTILFSILPFKENVIKVKLTATSLNHSSNVEDSLILSRWYSMSNNYLTIERNMKILSKCKSPQQYTVYYTTNKLKQYENITFYYMVKTRNEIVQMRKIQHTPRRHVVNFKNELHNIIGNENKFIKLENYVDKFILKFKLHSKMISKSQLMIYYISKDETVGNVIDIYVEKCLMNSVNSEWIDAKLYPGEEAVLNIQTSPNSLCAISAVDKATNYLSNNKFLTISQILQPYIMHRETKVSNKPNCLLNHKKKLEALYLEQLEDLRRRKRSLGLASSRDYDIYETFNNFGVSFITNLKMISKPCISEDAMPVPRFYSITSTLYEVLNEDRGVSIRSYFPETWLWELVPVGNSGVTQVARYLPHSITTWITNTLCISPTEGIGIAQKQEIVTFQPFFIDVLTPYSIKRGETLHLQVAVFNYMNFSLPIRLSYGNVQGLEFLDGYDKKRVSLCIHSNDMQTHTFRVKGSNLGETNVTIMAEIESSYPNECGPETIINKRDVIYKSLIVEPEGYPSETTKSIFLCGNGESNNVTWELDFSNDIVEDSEKVQVILNADLMGPTIQNLEKFLNIPTGCGEQIMAVLAPNLYVLKYLKSVNKLQPSLRQRAVKNIKIGYQRILDYAHKDGSFSAFGYHDPAGSMFLTAFVVRTLQHSKEFTYIDENLIKKATDWIIKHQLENGCFAAVSHVFQDMGGTSMENSTAALTAYVVISLLESNIKIPESVKTNAMYCIRGQHNPDKYTLIISAYALFLLDWDSEAERYLDRALQLATREGDLMWWSNQSGFPSVNIEITAYALLALMQKISNENLIHANSIVRWLGTQRNSQGGFTSTQDTVVALDAISRYSSLVKDRDPDLLVKLSGDNQKYDVNIRKNERMKSKQIVFASVPSTIALSASGQGCLLAQLSFTYNKQTPIYSEAFKLAIDVKPVSTIDKCSIAIITPCLSHKGFKHSNMAVLEVSMPSGYEADRASLYDLIENNNLTKVKRFEEYKNRVVLYFTELDNEPICVPFNINENLVVEDIINATVKLYDYYNPEIHTITTYQMEKCQPNEIALIPELKDNKENDKPIKVKRQVKGDRNSQKYGFNSHFVNMDIEMATPSGIEGNMPMYIKPDLDTIKSIKKNEFS